MLRIDALVDMVIEAKRSRAIASGRKFKLRKTPRVLPPTTPQREYLRELMQMNKLMRQIVGEVVAPLIPAIIEQANSQRPKIDSTVKHSLTARADDFNDLIDAAFERAKLQFYRKYTDQEVDGIARRAAGRVDNFNIRMINKIFGAVVEVKLPGNEPWLQQEIKAFTKSNVSLIKSISSQYFDKVEQQVTQAAQRGVLGRDFAKTIAKQYDLSESRAKLIARDQVSKFNADLTQSRQKSVGIKKYIWSTSGDERVRPSHEEKDGKEFSWDDPPWDGHPGEAINCVPDFALASIHAPAKKAFRRWYDGELTEIITDAIETLRVTPNHSVLTMRGWVPANLLEVGDYLIEASFQNVNFSVANPQGGNAKAEELFSSLNELGLRHRVRSRASWFHGDSGNEDVDIVNVNRALSLDGVSACNQSFGNDQLSFSHNTTLAQGNLTLNHVAFCSSSDGIIGGFSKARPLYGRSLAHSQKHCITTSSNGNLALSQDSSDGFSAQVELFSDSLLAKAVLVKPDNFKLRKVKTIMRSSWRGWVHNFETITGWFSSVNLVIHNCRCVALPVFDEG